MPTKEGIVKRLNFCLWTQGETAWLSVQLWDRGRRAVNVEDLFGRRCHGGLDMASKYDVAAWVLDFFDYPEAGWHTFWCRFWIPKKNAVAREQRDRVPYLLWERQGAVKLTDGDVIDPNVIEADILEDARRFQLVSAAYDTWNATQMALNLRAQGVDMHEFTQTPRNFNEPTKTFEALLKGGKLIHGDNPVLNWMASNVAVITDRNANVRPVKPEHQSPKKVDGIVAAVMALGRAITTAAPGASYYEDKPLEVG
jgi:phage terminase large subunit-like protein